MLKIQLKYLRYAVFALGLAIIYGVLTPLVVTWQPAVTLSFDYTYWLAVGSATVFLLFTGVRMTMQAINQLKTETVTTLWLPIIGQFIWLGLVVWLYVQPLNGLITQFLTLPIMFVGLAILYTSMGLLQRRERVIPMDEVQLRSVVRMTWVTVILAVYALLFFGITVNIQSGLTLALSVILIADPRWPSLWAGFRRFNILRDLSNQGVDFQNPRAIDAVADIKDLVIEKNGILSTQDDVRIHMIQSMDQRYSDFDIVGVAAGLMRNFPDEILADAITNFAQENGVYPSDASEPERTDFEAVHGVIYNERFAIISVPVALRDYQIDERHLKLMADLGNSLAYVVDGQEAIGVIVYSATADFQAMPFDRFMGERGLVGHVMSTDMNLATHKVTDLLPNIMTVATELLPDEKVQAQAQWANTSHSMLVTNQDIPEEVRPAISVAMGERPGWADIRLDDLAKFPLLWQTNDRLQGADKGILTRTSIVVILLIVLGTGMTMFINPLLFLPPILAVTIRLVVSFTVASVVSSKKEH